MHTDRPPFEVLYLDNHLLVIAKPPGLLAQADHTGDEDVLSLGKAYLKVRFNKPGNVFLGLVRLVPALAPPRLQELLVVVSAHHVEVVMTREDDRLSVG